jgi:GTP-binding protein Era
MRSGFVSLIGRPNAGKSTLMNSIVGRKIAITSNKPQTTRNVIQGVYHEEDTQIVFVDTPGVHKPNHKLGTYLNKQVYGTLDADVLLFLVDANEPFGRGDAFILDKLKEANKPIILVLNKIDTLKKEEIFALINQYKDIYSFHDIVPVSALKKQNIKELIQTIKKYLTDDVCYYDKETVTNKPISFLVSEIVREKAFLLTKEEVPHSLTCVVDSMKRKNNAYFIQVSIIVDRESLKRILIGKGGAMIKKIGTLAREELEAYFGKKVYLENFVKVIPKWRDKEKYLAEFGFNDFE